jgi:hypothetical protein
VYFAFVLWTVGSSLPHAVPATRWVVSHWHSTGYYGGGLFVWLCWGLRQMVACYFGGECHRSLSYFSPVWALNKIPLHYHHPPPLSLPCQPMAIGHAPFLRCYSVVSLTFKCQRLDGISNKSTYTIFMAFNFWRNERNGIALINAVGNNRCVDSNSFQWNYDTNKNIRFIISIQFVLFVHTVYNLEWV